MEPSEPLARFNNKILQHTALWDTYCNNYSLSYIKAYCRYASTLKLQADSNKQDAENRANLFMLAFTICGGTAFAAFFGKATMKTLAAQFVRNKAMEAFIKQESMRAFNALAWIDNNAAAKFAMGKVWDEGQKFATEKLKKSFNSMGTNPAPFSGGDLTITSNEVTIRIESVRTQLKNTLNRWVYTVSEAGLFAHDHLGGEDGMTKLYNNSPFFTRPVLINTENLANKIELVLWLQFILNQDYVHDYIDTTRDCWEGSVPITTNSKTSIEISPKSNKYPQSVNYRGGRSVIVKYNKIGDIIKNRINELHLSVLHNNEVFSNNFGYLYKNASRETLKYAEHSLQLIGNKNIDALLLNKQ